MSATLETLRRNTLPIVVRLGVRDLRNWWLIRNVQGFTSKWQEACTPFYGEYAWAFDLLNDRPVAKEFTAIAGWLVENVASPRA